MTDPTTPSSPTPGRPVVYLHIGTLKSGTSYLQQVLVRNRDLLAHEGTFFPTGDRGWGVQVRAVRDLMSIKGRTSSENAWLQLVESIRAAQQPVTIVSMEFLSFADTETIQRAVADLDGYDVHAVLGLRDLVRVLPSAWQSMVKQGNTWSFADFLASVTSTDPADPDPHTRFWRHHDVDKIIETWTDVIGDDRVHLLVVPPSGAPPTALWERFCSVVGLTADRYDASQDQGSNFSLSYSDTELMRRVTLAVSDDLEWVTFKRWVTRVFANQILRADHPDQTRADRVPVDASSRRWATEQSAALARRLRLRGLDVTGDLDELVPEVDPRPDDTSVTSVPAVVYPEAAVDVIVKLVRRLALREEPAEQHEGGRRGGRRGGKGRRRATREEPDETSDDDDVV